MRRFAHVLVLALLVLAAYAVARADEPAGDPVERLQQQVQALETRVGALAGEVAYLRSREADLTAFALGHAAWSQDLLALVGRAESQGFLQRAIPVESRQTLLEALKGFAAALGKGLPAVTKAQEQQLRDAEKSR
jgi:hypothetical protein